MQNLWDLHSKDLKCSKLCHHISKPYQVGITWAATASNGHGSGMGVVRRSDYLWIKTKPPSKYITYETNVYPQKKCSPVVYSTHCSCLVCVFRYQLDKQTKMHLQRKQQNNIVNRFLGFLYISQIFLLSLFKSHFHLFTLSNYSTKQ